MNKLQALAILLLVAGTIIAGIAYTQIPGEEIASHWNAQGQVDDHTDKLWGLFMFPAILVALYALFLAIPLIDPLKENIKKFREHYDTFIVVFLAFMVYMELVVIIWNLGFPYSFHNINIAILPAMAFLFYYISILLQHTKRNWFVGIRTPWTISNDKVWAKTHEIGSKWFKALAVYFVLLLFLEDMFLDYMVWLLLIPILGVSFGLIIYSYWVYSKLKK